MPPTGAVATDQPIGLDSDFFADPYPTYRQIASRGGSPVRVVLRKGMAYLPDNLNAWLLTSYDDVQFALQDPRFQKNLPAALDLFTRTPTSSATNKPRPSLLYDNMANNDPPEHTRLRKPLNSAFTSRAATAQQDRIRSTALATADRLGKATAFDLVTEFALPFSIAVICDLLGVPESDHRPFHDWATTITTAAEPAALTHAVAMMTEYLGDLIEHKKEEPAADVLSGLAQSADLDAASAVAQAYALLVAGYETTANLISTGFLALESDQQQKRALWSDPSAVPQAVQELLRHQSPFNLSLYRYVAEDVEVNGVVLPAGSIAFLGFAAANRDESRFPKSAELDLQRHPREHLAFGGGIHNCIGKHLAVVEAETAFEVLIERYPNLHIIADRAHLQWKVSPTFRGLKGLMVGTDPSVRTAR